MKRFKLDLPRRTVFYAALAIVLAVVFVAQEAGTTRRNTIALPDIPDSVDRIELSEGDETLVLRRATGDEPTTSWTVGEAAYPADTDRIESVVESLRAVDEVDVVTARDDYSAYGLAGSARTVSFFTDDDEILSITVGETASAGDATYARINGAGEVVLVPGSIATEFSTNPDDFRPAEILAIPESEVQRLTITSPNAQPVVVRRAAATSGDDETNAASAEPEWQIESDLEISDSRVDLAFGALDPLRADGFPDAEPTGEPFATLEVRRTNGDVVEISLWPPVDDDTYPARASSYDYPFLVRLWRVRRLLLQVDDFLAPFEDDAG